MTATKNHTKAKAIGKNTIPVSSQQEANDRFKSMVKPKDDTRSNYVAEFLVMARRIFDTGGNRSFDFSDFINANKVFEIPIDELDRLFKRYVEALQSWRVVEEIHGAYDHPCYLRMV